MAHDFSDDLSALFDLNVFGVAAAFAAPVGTVTVMYDQPFADVLGVAGNAPEIWAKTTDVAAVTVGMAVTVNDTAYTVASIEPDGTGVTRLTLEEA
jgi:hypothetical protein